MIGGQPANWCLYFEAIWSGKKCNDNLSIFQKVTTCRFNHNIMKKMFFPITLITALTLCLTGVEVFSQKSGLYLSYSDYKKDSLSYKSDCNEKHKIKLTGAFSNGKIIVIHEGEKLKLKKKSIYGVLMCDGSLYRIVGNIHFKMMEEGKIILYSRSVNGTKTTTITKYYFSLDGQSAISQLTLKSLMDAFPSNHKMHDELPVWFKSENDLFEYDNYHKAFKINRFLEKFMNWSCISNESYYKCYEQLVDLF